MKIETHNIKNVRIAEITSDKVIFNSAFDIPDILGNLYYHGFERMIIHEQNITPEFFDLKTGIAGEILQKFSNYRIRLAIIGDFGKYTNKSRSINDFIFESNNGKHINFVSSLNEGLSKLSDEAGK